MIFKYFAYLALGKLSIYLLRKFPPAVKLASRWKFSEQLFNCDLCLGLWVYWFLALMLGMDITQPFKHRKGFSELLTGGVSSFVMYLISVGWDDLFREYRIEE